MAQRRGAKTRHSLLNFIRWYLDSNGYPPSITDMSAATGLVRSNVYHHLRILEEEGKLTHTEGTARSWVLLAEHDSGVA